MSYKFLRTYFEMEVKMKDIHNKILKYLYNNDTGNYVDLYAKFEGKKIDKERLQQVAKDLNEYLERESIYENRGILILDDSAINNHNELTNLNVRINQKGRERYENIWNKEKAQSTNKKIAFFTLAGVVVALLVACIPNISKVLNKENEDIPRISLKINNN
ncbi:MAG TPA: hypothetical protein VF941_06200, partial [Clostridia bacterium]